PIHSIGMHVRAILVIGLVLAATASGRAQEHPARRLSSIVGVAVEEYSKGVDDAGNLTSELEYQEAVDFLQDARTVADRLSGDRAATVRLLVDSLRGIVAAKRPRSEIEALHQRFVAALGNEGALELPTRSLDASAGGRLYAQQCASCHGPAGLGDGPQAVGITPPPPPIGDPVAMIDRTPALLFRVISVGVAGTPMVGWADRLTADQRWDIVAYLHALRATEAQRLEGEGLYARECLACHGPVGSADGPAAASLTRLPADIGTFAWQAERSDADLAAIVRDGIAGTAMPPNPALTSQEVTRIVAHLRTVAATRPGTPNVQQADDPQGIARRVLAMLDRSLAAARAGRTPEAGDLAFDAYLAFEPLETRARARDPGLVAAAERQFADFKGAVRGGDLRAAERAHNTIEAQLPSIVELTSAPSGRWATFFQSFLIILREGFEAILVIGAICAFLLKTGNRARLRSIWVGSALALVASAATAIVLQTVLRSMPASREIIEGATMLVAVLVLFSVSYWLISKVEAARWQQFIREKVTTALEHGGGSALAFVAFLAVYREGAETALFYQALFGEGSNAAAPIALGIVVGAAVLAVIFTLFYRYGVKIPLRPFFAVTSVVLYYMAFVFAGKGVRELQEGNVVPITTIPGFPSFDAMGIYNTVETLLAQLLLIVLFVFAVVKTFWPSRSVSLPTAPPSVVPVGDVTARLARMQEAIEMLRARVEAIEETRGQESGVRDQGVSGSRL
ncbi:MAG TPA: cytochrome c/FTR1 family iron permease, partial [Gemmatimonadaceae bacterium]|nr:cytochrome c/FTR1 family iron permease [Gemmatimonadaceae bacterium]